jgi:hypothetical protein
MATCKYCGLQIEFAATRFGRPLPVEGEATVAIDPRKGIWDPLSIMVLTESGDVVRGQQVGEAYEGKAVDGRVVHKCRGEARG